MVVPIPRPSETHRSRTTTKIRSLISSASSSENSSSMPLLRKGGTPPPQGETARSQNQENGRVEHVR